MRLEKLPLRTSIEYDGQSYVDQPIYKSIKPSVVAIAVCGVFGHSAPKPIEILERYEHTKLRWMKPDGKGGLTPR